MPMSPVHMLYNSPGEKTMENTINKENKDRLFKIIFGRNENREWTLSLYNAINGSSYTNPEDITITTVEDVLYLSMKNDVSFLIADTMNLYEHQSSYNPNMPIRMLMYSGMVYSRYIEEKGIDMYRNKLRVFPSPRLVTFYNGLKETEDRVVLKISDAFNNDPESDIEVRVLMLNINHGRNKELLEHCRPLNDYSQFVDTVRVLKREGLSSEDAVHLAIRKLDGSSAIRRFLLAHEAEVKMSVLTEFKETEYYERLQKECHEEGRAEGRAEGEERMSTLVNQLLNQGRYEDIAKVTSDVEYRNRLYKELGIT